MSSTVFGLDELERVERDLQARSRPPNGSP